MKTNFNMNLKLHFMLKKLLEIIFFSYLTYRYLDSKFVEFLKYQQKFNGSKVLNTK